MKNLSYEYLGTAERLQGYVAVEVVGWKLRYKWVLETEWHREDVSPTSEGQSGRACECLISWKETGLYSPRRGVCEALPFAPGGYRQFSSFMWNDGTELNARWPAIREKAGWPLPPEECEGIKEYKLEDQFSFSLVQAKKREVVVGDGAYYLGIAFTACGCPDVCPECKCGMLNVKVTVKSGYIESVESQYQSTSEWSGRTRVWAGLPQTRPINYSACEGMFWSWVQRDAGCRNIMQRDPVAVQVLGPEMSGR